MSSEDAAPLRGLTFLNTRDQGSAPALTEMLMELGGDVVECPTIEIIPPPNWDAFDMRLRSVTRDDWIVFTSANAARATLDRLWSLNRPLGDISQAHIAAIGHGTGDVLRKGKIRIDLMPEISQQEILLRAMLARLKKGNRVWIPRALVAREVLTRGLREAGYDVEVTPVYRTVPPKRGLGRAVEAIRAGRVDWMLFTSTSTVVNFFDLLDADARAALEHRWPNVACIGAVTAESAREHGLHVQVVPSRQDLSGMVAALVEHISGGAPPPPE